MSEQQNPQNVTTHRIEVAAARAAESAAHVEDFQRMNRDQFNARIAEAEEAGVKRVLKSLGFKREERAAVYADIAAGRMQLTPKPKDGDLDYKSEYEKLKPFAAENELLKSRLNSHTEVFKGIAKAAFEKLSDKAQKAVTARAGEDPEKILAEIDYLRNAGLLDEAPPADPKAKGAQTTAQQTEPKKPATTGNAGGPAPAGGNTKTAWDRYEELKKTDRMHAAIFLKQNQVAIDASRPK